LNKISAGFKIKKQQIELFLRENLAGQQAGSKEKTCFEVLLNIIINTCYFDW
jgi:hypothetical protein